MIEYLLPGPGPSGVTVTATRTATMRQSQDLSPGAVKQNPDHPGARDVFFHSDTMARPIMSALPGCGGEVDGVSSGVPQGLIPTETTRIGMGITGSVRAPALVECLGRQHPGSV